MARYIQRAKVKNDQQRISYDYMGSAEFEWGAPQSARAVIRFGESKTEVVPDHVVLIDDGKGKIDRDALVIIAPAYQFADGTNYFDIAKQDLIEAIHKAHEGTQQTKEWTNFEMMIGYPESLPRLTTRKEKEVDNLTTNFWLKCDAFVHNEIKLENGKTKFTEREAVIGGIQRHFKFLEEHTSTYETQAQLRQKNVVWIACPASMLDIVMQASEFTEVRGLNAVNEADLRMFDKVKFRDGSRMRHGKVVGLLAEGVRVEFGDHRKVVRPSQIMEILTA